MKSFFEQYGFVILAAIVVILLIAMCTPVGNVIKGQISNVVLNMQATESRYANNLDTEKVKEGDMGNAERIANTLYDAYENKKITFSGTDDQETIAIVVGKSGTKVLASGLIRVNGKTWVDDTYAYERVFELLKRKAINADSLKNENTLDDNHYFYAIFLYADGTVKYGAGDEEGYNAYVSHGNELEKYANYWRTNGFDTIEEALANK